MYGICDICESKSGAGYLSRATVSGIETFVCEDCAEARTEKANRRTEQQREERLEHLHDMARNR